MLFALGRFVDGPLHSIRLLALGRLDNLLADRVVVLAHARLDDGLLHGHPLLLHLGFIDGAGHHVAAFDRRGHAAGCRCAAARRRQRRDLRRSKARHGWRGSVSSAAVRAGAAIAGAPAPQQAIAPRGAAATTAPITSANTQNPTRRRVLIECSLVSYPLGCSMPRSSTPAPITAVNNMRRAGGKLKQSASSELAVLWKKSVGAIPRPRERNSLRSLPKQTLGGAQVGWDGRLRAC